MIELTPEERKSIQEGRPVHVRDNGQEYVLLRPDVYKRLLEASMMIAPGRLSKPICCGRNR